MLQNDKQSRKPGISGVQGASANLFGGGTTRGHRRSSSHKKDLLSQPRHKRSCLQQSDDRYGVADGRQR